MEDVQGQLEPNTQRGQWIKNFLQQNDFKNIVEIGTWKGLGSTLCILEGKKNDSNFYSLECDRNMFEIAKKNLSQYSNQLQLIYGTICTEEEILNFVSDIYLDDQKRGWLDYDLQNLKLCEYVLDKLPEEIDFLLLDGGEFSTYSEWNKLKDRTKIVAMDDISQIKNNKIHHELSNSDEWSLLTLISEGNGFSAFQKNKEIYGK
jgi:hypothetical protein